jgi:hypothetical protein
MGGGGGWAGGQEVTVVMSTYYCICKGLLGELKKTQNPKAEEN